jgi:hypothetical protein
MINKAMSRVSKPGTTTSPKRKVRTTTTLSLREQAKQRRTVKTTTVKTTTIIDRSNPKYKMFKTTKSGKYIDKDISEGKFKRVAKRLENRGGEVSKSDMTNEVMDVRKTGKGFKEKAVSKIYNNKLKKKYF